MNKILFISQLYFAETFDSYLKNTKANLDYAANNLGRAIIKGFEQNNISFSVLNTPLLGSYPFYFKKIYINGVKNNNAESISYLNIIYLKRFVINNKVRRKIIEWCSKDNENRIVFLYSYTFVPLIEEIKNLFPDLKCFILAADLPEYMSTDSGLITKLHHFMGGNKPASGHCYDLIDGYVLLAEAMKHRLPVQGKPWIVVEGIYNPEQDDVVSEKDNHKAILYTGSLGRKYGIVELLEAFHGIINPQYRLWICGEGDGRENVENYEKLDSRIEYKGMLGRRDIIKLQKAARLLVNPRRSNEEYTKYSFPSKTMEYMASGTPTLMAHLQCMPKDYDEHLYYFNNETIEGLRARMVDICEKKDEELFLKGKNAAAFIKQYKTPLPQVGKILNFIESVVNE